MNNIAKVLTGLAAIFFVAQAQAQFMIEPFVGYEMGEIKIGSSAKADLSGTEYGVRLGATMAMFSFGAEYAGASIKQEKSSTLAAGTISSSDLGAFVAFEFPVLIRAYATYFIQSKGTQGSNSFKGDGGIRLGIGYTGLPFVSINFEHITRNYDKNNSTTIDGTATTNMLSVSLPLP